MALNLGLPFETAVATLAGINTDTFDPGSLQIPMINPAQKTTIRFTVHIDVDTTALRAAITDALSDE